MRKISKVLSMVLAISMLSASPAWAVKKEQHQETAGSKLIKHDDVQSKWKSFIGEEKKSSGKAVTKSISPNKLPAEMKSALRKMQAVLPELKELDLERVNIAMNSVRYPETWDFHFEKRVKETKIYIYADVEYLPETGQIIEYDIENAAWTSENTISEEEAKEKANQFVKKLLGNGMKDYKFTNVSQFTVWVDDEDGEEEREQQQSYVEYQLFINNLPVQDFTLGVLLDGDGHILQFNNARPEKVSKAKFPNPKKAMTQEKAEEIFLDKLDMKLAYQFVAYDDQYGPLLTYSPSFTSPIDAATGKEYDITYRPHFQPERVEFEGGGKEFIAGSRQEAERVLSELGIDLSKLEYMDSEDDEEEGVIFYRWIFADQQDEGSISLLVDKATGKIQRFSQRKYNNENGVNVSRDEALQTAVEGLHMFLPTGTEEIQLSDMEGPTTEYKFPSWVDEDKLPGDFKDPSYTEDYFFYFDDVYDDTPVISGAYMVSIDSTTGMLRSVVIDPVDLNSLPDKEKAISPEEAAKNYIKQFPVKLTYVWPQLFGQRAPAPTLVYDIDDVTFIDANSISKKARKHK